MNGNESARRRIDNDLGNFIRPLANYICANDQPRVALKNVLAAVLHEVRETNRAALAQFGVYSENCCS